MKERPQDAWQRGYLAGAEHVAKDFGIDLLGVSVSPYVSPERCADVWSRGQCELTEGHDGMHRSHGMRWEDPGVEELMSNLSEW